MGLGRLFTAAKLLGSGEIKVVNIKQLAKQQVVASGRIRENLDDQLKALNVLERELKQCKQLLNQHDKSILRRAAGEQVLLIIDDFKLRLQQMYTFIRENTRLSYLLRKVKKSLKSGRLESIENAIKKLDLETRERREEFETYKSSLGETSGKFEAGLDPDYSRSLKNDMVNEIKLMDEINLRLFQIPQLIEGKRERIEVIERKIEELQRLIDQDNARIKKIMDKLKNMKVSPERVKFSSSEEMAELFGRVGRNYGFVGDFLRLQKGYYKYASWVSITPATYRDLVMNGIDNIQDAAINPFELYVPRDSEGKIDRS